MSRSRSGSSRWGAAALAAGVLVLVGPAPAASAHTSLTSSDPAADSTLAVPPTTVELVFAGPVRSPDPVIAVTIDGWEPVEVPAVIDGTTVTARLDGVDVPGFSEASYPVSWRLGFRLTAADGDPFSGLLDFTVATGPPGAPTGGSDAAPTGALAGAEVSAGPARVPAVDGRVVATAAVVSVAVAAGLLLAVRRRREVGA